MPYCNQCGTFVVDEDRFCPTCGTRQYPEGVTPPPPKQQPPRPVTPPPAAEASATAGTAGAASVPPTAVKPGALQPHIAAMLCYIPAMGWIAALVFLLLEGYRHDRYVRFHAFQGLFLAVLWLIFKSMFFPFHGHDLPFMGFRALWLLLVIVLQVVGIIKTLSHQPYRIPVLGDLAEKSMA